MSTLPDNLADLMRNQNALRILLREHPNISLTRLYKKIMNVSEDSNDGTCYNYSEGNPDPTNSQIAIIIFGIVYLHIFILGLVGNLSIVLLTLRYKHLRTVQNIFILNLAIADVIVCLLSVPLTPITSINKVWLFGLPLCHLLPMVQAVGIFVSTLSLSAIAIDRYNLVVRPHVQALSVRGAINVAIILWIVSILASLPYGFYMNLESYDGICGEFCSENWPSKSIQRGYALIVLIMQFLLPFLTMSFCYATIFSRLRERANQKLRKLNERSQLLSIKSNAPNGDDSKPPRKHKKATPQQSIDDSQRTILLNQQRRTTSILASMVLVFGLAWLPHNVYTLLLEFDEEFLSRGGVNYMYLVSTIAHCISMITNITQPLLYAWVNPTFKKLFLQTFKNAKLPDSSDTTLRLQRELSQRTRQTLVSSHQAHDFIVRMNGCKPTPDGNV